jgi:hypothetical protein
MNRDYEYIKSISTCNLLWVQSYKTAGFAN